MKNNTQKIVLAALFIAIGVILPFLTMQIPTLGSMLLPMHFPVIIGGFICGGPIGALIGFIVPLLRSMLFSMPPMFPSAIAMAFELATYGFISGFLYQRLKPTVLNTYLTLIGAMIGGRIIWGIVSFILYGFTTQAFGFSMFVGGAIINAIPGIILQLIIIPIIVISLQKTKWLR